MTEILVGVAAVVVTAGAVWFGKNRIEKWINAAELKVANWAHIRIGAAEERLKSDIAKLHARIAELESKVGITIH